jgi:hypothetical protein
MIMYEGTGKPQNIAINFVLMNRYLCYVPPNWPILPEAASC